MVRSTLHLSHCTHGLPDYQGMLVASHTDLVIARAAIDGAIILWQEWHLRFSTTLGTSYGMHFARGTLAATRTTIRLTTGGTA
ncbi:hypothetical protein KDI_10450 [Dictyobacter arantiisoli]|uniref:Uncharacterized protein n=1 Tax=Dictyobacter arantiisoli TaxID=2014874 RepID=A0A5A5T7Q0_9CHLR|nr:hypothetical protein KDI_10450 [Dictyobacter arantiisoli]